MRQLLTLKRAAHLHGVGGVLHHVGHDAHRLAVRLQAHTPGFSNAAAWQRPDTSRTHDTEVDGTHTACTRDGRQTA